MNSQAQLRLALTLFVIIFACGCRQKQPAVPTGIPVPTGWVVLVAELNTEMGFEGTNFYARFESSLPADEAAMKYANALLASTAKGFELEGAVKLSDDELKNHKNDQAKFEGKHLVDASNYKSGYRVSLSDEPSYYVIYAFPQENGSIVELLRISAL